MKHFGIRTLALLAMFTAVSIILARLLGFYVTESLRVSFEYFPIVMAGILFGPIAGAVVGGLADVLGATLLSGLGVFPLLTVGPMLAGLLAGLMSRYVFKENLDRWWKVMAVVCVAELCGNLLWGTFALSVLYGSPFLPYLALRTPLKLAIIVVDAQLVFALSRALKPVIIRQRS